MNHLETLLQDRLGPRRDLDQWISRRRNDNLSWDDIARLLSETTGVEVGREWVRRRHLNQTTGR